MAEKEQNPIFKMALEIGPIVLFFLAYRWAPVSEGASDSEAQLEQILFATAVFVPVILATLAISWITTRHLPKMALVTAVLVVVFGGLTLWLRDDTFIKMKPTILYCVFALGLGIGLVRGESYLEYLMEGAVPMTREGWMTFTFRFAVFFAALAVANEVVWRSTTTDTWVNFKTFFLPIASFVFVASQAGLFMKHAPKEEAEDASGSDESR